MLESLTRQELIIVVPGTSYLWNFGYLPTPKREKTTTKEKRLEKEFGKSLADQGISVQHQVKCEVGIADIVTPDAIYEVKASLSRSNIFRAASQVLLYRNCINPSAKAVIVGYPHDKEPVNVEIANKLGIEVVVCEDKVAKEYKKAVSHMQVNRIDFEYAMEHLTCIHEARFNNGFTYAGGYIDGYTQPVTIIRQDTEKRAKDLIELIKDEPWCNVLLLQDGRFDDGGGIAEICPCSTALERECNCCMCQPKSKEVFVKHYNMTIEEAAAHLGLSVGDFAGLTGEDGLALCFIIGNNDERLFCREDIENIRKGALGETNDTDCIICYQPSMSWGAIGLCKNCIPPIVIMACTRRPSSVSHGAEHDHGFTTCCINPAGAKKK